MNKKTIIVSEWYNAIYEDGLLLHQGEPEYLDGETMVTLFPDADLYGVPYNLHDELVGENGYPEHLNEFPLEHCERYR